MHQLRTLIWLKWRLFRNSMRTSKAVVNRLASILGMLFALGLALVAAGALGVAAYALTSPELGLHEMAASEKGGGHRLPSAEVIFFSIFSFSYLLWATLPLSIGGTRQFDPGNLLLYPISLKKLFAVDFVSEIASLQSIFGIPAVMAVGLGVGLATGRMISALLIAAAAALFGLALSKLVSTSIGALMRRKRTRGETILAVVTATAGLGGALFGQIAPVIVRNAESFKVLRWTPPGAAAFALTEGLAQPVFLVASFLLLLIFSAALIVLTYWLELRAVTGGGRRKKGTRQQVEQPTINEAYAGWHIAGFSPDLSAIVEKEIRYHTRNAQIRMMTLLPLILILIRLVNSTRFNSNDGPGPRVLGDDFFTYAEGLMTTGAMLYIFLILSGLYCNSFSFEEGGMRSLVLSPVQRAKILIGKNLAITAVALIFSAGLLIINQLVFGDVNFKSLLFAIFSFIIFASMLSIMGNWFSIRFPKPMKFGKRLNVAGVVGVLLIPMIVLMTLPPLASVAAGYVTRSLLIEYATLGVLALASIGFYLLVIKSQGEMLQRREVEILETVTKTDG